MKATHRPRRPRPLVATLADAPRWGTVALWMLLVLLVLALSLPARAGDLQVLPAAAANGTNYGLRVTPGSECTPPNDLPIINEFIHGSYQACNSITAGVNTASGVKTDGDTTFTAGDAIVLRNKFTVDTGDSFTAIISSPLTQWAYVQDNSPVAEKTYNASFFLRLDNLIFGDEDDRLHHFVGYSSNGIPWFRVVLRLNSGEKRLYLEARRNDSTWASTEGSSEVRLDLDPGYKKIEINWSAGSGNGELLVKLDDVFAGPGLTGLSNNGAQIDYVKWGAVGTDPGAGIAVTSGYLDVDEFSSWR